MSSVDTAALDRLAQAAETCAKRWTKCDWTTDLGRAEVDIDGRRAADLRTLVERIDALRDDLPHYSRVGRDGQPVTLDDLRDDLARAADYAEEVEADAEEAAERARDIIEAIRSGDREEMEALMEVREGEWYLRSDCDPAEIEREHGDAPTWGKWSEDARQLLADILGESE